MSAWGGVCVFQESHQDSTILDDVVEITVENEIVTDLPEPIRIAFHHDVIPVSGLVFVVCLSSFIYLFDLFNSDLTV